MTELPQHSVYADNPRLEMKPFIPAEARSVLDVGCGSGGFGRTLRKALGAEAYILGLDAVRESVESARVGHGYDRVEHGYFPANIAPDDKFDLITFIDVLEHILDPSAVLEEARSHLTPNGVIVAAIPSVQVWNVVARLIVGRWDYADSGTLDRTHVRFFTKSTMIELFESAGYQVSQCTGVNSLLPTRMRPIGRFVINSLKWLPARLNPDMQWLHFVVVGKPATSRFGAAE